MWDPEQSLLTFGGERARVVARRAVNLIPVLDSFQRAGWPVRIDDPLADPKAPSKDVQRLHETIKSLNKNIELIEFHADGRGKGITWHVKP